MGYAPYKGATYVAMFNEVPHLFAVLNDPCKDQLCLIVMFNSIKPTRMYDPACVLYDCEPEFLNRDTYISYRIATNVRASHIGNMVDKNAYTPWPDLHPAIYKRICAGLYMSDETRPTMFVYAGSVGI